MTMNMTMAGASSSRPSSVTMAITAQTAGSLGMVVASGSATTNATVCREGRAASCMIVRLAAFLMASIRKLYVEQASTRTLCIASRSLAGAVWLCA
jgi:hypothetical protein